MTAPKKRTELKRDAIVQAGITQFTAKGFKSTSMDEIAKTAVVSKRTVYNHFASKEALFEEIAKQMFLMSRAVSEIVYDPLVDIKIQLRNLAEAELQLVANQQFRDLVKVMLTESVHSPDLTNKIVADFNKQQTNIVRWVEEAIADKKLKVSNPEMAVSQFLGIIKACAFWPQILLSAPTPSKTICRQIADDAVIMFLARYSIM